MTLPPASLPAASLVPLSVPLRGGAGGRQSRAASGVAFSARPANSIQTSRPAAGGQGRTREAAARATTRSTGDGNSSDESESPDSPEQAFADMIQQMSAESSPSQPAPASATQARLRQFQIAGASAAPIIETGSVSSPASLPATRAVSKKEASGGSAPAPSASSGPVVTAPPARDRQQAVLAVPVDVIPPLPVVKPKLSELAGGGCGETQLHPQPARAADTQSEAALNVVIRNGDPAPTPLQTDSAQQAASTSAAVTAQAAENAGTEPDLSTSLPPVKSGDAVATAGDVQNPIAASSAAYATVAPVSTLAAESSPERRKTAIAVDAGGPGADAVKSSNVPQTAALQDLQLKAEPAKNSSTGAPRDAAPGPPAAASEPTAPEKGSAQPLKAVSLEFAPDGARDVKVRLSERAGEVHVSVHSTDPSVTKNLRAGVTDLASMLASAGYDAKTWTSDRRQQDNPQQQDERTPQPRRAAAGAESFDGILQRPNQENS